jgi:serine/threonine-protein kinase RIO1
MLKQENQSSNDAEISSLNDEEPMKVDSEPRPGTSANVWGIKQATYLNDATENDASKPNFLAILQEEEEIKAKKTKNVQFSEENNRVISDEEEMIRQAIEASLKDENHKSEDSLLGEQIMDREKEMDEEEMIRLAIEASLGKDNAKNSACSESTRQISPLGFDSPLEMDDEMDDDMKLAIQLSMAEMNKTPLEEEDVWDRKMPAKVDVPQKGAENENLISDVKQSSVAVASMPPARNIAQSEEEEIARAIMEADDREQAESLRLAMELQEEENLNFEKMKVDRVRNANARSNVRTVSKHEFEYHSTSHVSEKRQIFSHADVDHHDEIYGNEIHNHGVEDEHHHNSQTSGFSINASTPSKTWSRLDDNHIIGPNNEIRTKHDVELKNHANASRLLGPNSSLANKSGTLAVSDAAYNSFNRSLKSTMRRRAMVKGVERSGTGRAENITEKTRGGALDANVRLLLTKAINNGMITHCNGAVKEGKEAIVYHADGGTESEGYDVAVKVFKRIQEFRNRSAYVDSDPRYHGSKFRNADKRQQVELWTEKEYRNLVRAHRGGVAVPTPLMQKENVLFMRFLGDGGWPATQLREVELKRTSKRWRVLYIQCLAAIRRLYHCAKLIHADLSEYNILVCPMSQVENAMNKSEEAKDDLQIVLIDFGQAVELKHPDAMDLLKRDLSMVNAFFKKQDMKTLTEDESLNFVIEDFIPSEEEEEKDEEADSQNKKMDDYALGEGENEVWRHSIPGWSDVKDMERLEDMLGRKML